MPVQKGFTINVNQCISCRACEAACKAEYGLNAGQGRRRRVVEKSVAETVDGRSQVSTFFISLACNHCVNPSCLSACPKGAYTKDTDGSISGQVGLVLHDPAKCIGCRRCEWACPYGAPQYNPATGKIHKCEGCWQRQANTTLHTTIRVPACVATCLTGALAWRNVDTGAASEAWDDGGGSETYVKAGAAGRGSAYLADATLTNPAVKIRNRVYAKRDGTGVV